MKQLLLMAAVCDLVATACLLTATQDGSLEANPLARFLYETGGIPWLVALKSFTTATFFQCGHMLETRGINSKPLWILGVTLWFLGATIGAVCNLLVVQ